MKYYRVFIVLICCSVLTACSLFSGDSSTQEKPAQPTKAPEPAQPAQPAQPVQPTQPAKKPDTAYFKKFKCPENANKILFSSDWNPLATTNIDILSAYDDGSEITRLTDRTVWEGNPVWSPDRCRIAYTAVTDSSNAFDKNTLKDIYTMDPDGANRSRLTTSEGNDHDPDWSPDGKQLVFTSERDKNREIYIMSSKGTNQERLTNNKTDDNFPHWSPNNDRIAFSTHRDGNWEIYLMDIDGKNLLNLTKNKSDDKDSAWSPDGSQIAFFSNRTGMNEIYIMNKDGSNLRQITHQSGKEPSVDQDISWSPDGQWIGFTGTVTAKDGGKIQAIFKAAIDGSGVQKVVNRDPSTSNDMEW